MEYKNTKWKRVNLNSTDADYIYQRLRMKAKTILKSRHEKEYFAILNDLLELEYEKYNKATEIKKI